MPVNMPAQSAVEEAPRPGPERPEGQRAVEKEEEEKLQRAREGLSNFAKQQVLTEQLKVYPGIPRFLLYGPLIRPFFYSA